MKDKKQLIKRLGEIKIQLECIKQQENNLKTEYENTLLEIWELLPITEEKKVIKKRGE